MLKVLWGPDTAQQSSLMEDIWRFRHEQFVERLGWEDVRRHDGREIDEFDGPRAIHFPQIDQAGNIVGYSRLLPTTEPHLLSHVYPELMSGRPCPRGDVIYEWTRCVAAAGADPIDGVAVSNRQMAGVLEYCLLVGIETLVVETYPKLLNLFLSTGWDVMPLNAPSQFKDHFIVPFCVHPSAATLEWHHRNYGIRGSLLDDTVEIPVRYIRMVGHICVETSVFVDIRGDAAAKFQRGCPPRVGEAGGVEGNGAIDIEFMPEIDEKEGVYLLPIDIIVANQPGTNASCPGIPVIHIDPSGEIVNCVEVLVLPDDLRLGFDRPVFADIQGNSGFERSRDGISIEISGIVSNRFRMHIQPGIHQHGIDIGSFFPGMRPVAAKAIGVDVEGAGEEIELSEGKTADVAIGSAVTDKEAQRILLAVTMLGLVDRGASLDTPGRPVIVAGKHICEPLLIFLAENARPEEVFRFLAREPVLFAMAFVECTEGRTQ